MLTIHEQSFFLLPKLMKLIALFSKDQPLKYLKLHFSAQGLSLSTYDSSQQISLGAVISKSDLKAYICQKELACFIPLQKFAKALQTAEEFNDNITLTYQETFPILNIRLYCSKTNDKITMHFHLKSNQKYGMQFGEMVSQKYQEPTNPVYLMKSQGAGQTFDFSTKTHFIMPRTEMIRVFQQFFQVAKQVQLKFQTEAKSNKKYLIISALTQKGWKSLTLSDQKKQPQISAQLQYLIIREQQLVNQGIFVQDQNKISIFETFQSKNLYKASMIGNQDSIYEDNAKIILVKGKYLFFQFYLKKLAQIQHKSSVVALILPFSFI